MDVVPSAASLPAPVQVLIEPFVINRVSVTAGNAVMDARMLRSRTYTALHRGREGFQHIF